MKRILIILFFLPLFTKAQTYQNLPQSYKSPRYQLDSVLTIPMLINRLRNISVGRDSGQIRYNPSDSSVYVYTGKTWVKQSSLTSVYRGVDSIVVTGNNLCQWSLGIPTCYTISATPSDTTVSGIDSVVVSGNNLCQWKGGVSTCYTVTNTIINNTNNYITNVYTGVDSVVVSGTNLCQWSGGIATCYTISTAPGDTTISGIDSVTIQGSQLCQWKAGVSTCYTVTNTINNSSVTNYIDSSITNVFNYLDSSTVIINSGSGLDSIRINGYQICFYLHDSASPRCWQLNTFFDDVRLSDDSTLYEFYNGDSLVKTVPSGIKNVGAVWPLSYNGVNLTTSKPFNDSLYLSSLVLHGTSLYSKKLTGDSVFVGIMGSGGSSGIDSMYVTTDSLYQVFIYHSGRRDSVGYSGSSGTGGSSISLTYAIGKYLNAYGNFVSFNDTARAAISLTNTGTSGASTYNSSTGVLNVPTYTLAGLGGISLSSLSATSPIFYNNSTGVISSQAATGSQNGYLTSTDWTTFNNKGSGTVTGGSITWPGTIYSTPTTGSVSTGTLTFAPSLANQSAYTNFGNNTSSSAAPTFFANNYSDSLKRSTDSIFRRVNGNWYYQYKDSTGGGGITGSGSATRIPFWNGTSSITSDSSFRYNLALHRMTVDSMVLWRGQNQIVGNISLSVPHAGIYSLQSITTGNYNVFFSTNGGGNITTGQVNVGVGASALLADTSGSKNVAVGHAALAANTNGSDNTGVGYLAANVNTTGIQNTAVGSWALKLITTPTGNTGVGYEALGYITTQGQNTAIGKSAGSYYTGFGTLTSATNSIFIGSNALAHANSESNQIVIGTSAIGLGSNTTTIGNSSTTDAAIYGSLMLGTTTPVTGALLNMSSTTKGLLLPRMTKAQRDAIGSPVAGLMVWQTDNTPGPRWYDGTNWNKVALTTD